MVCGYYFVYSLQTVYYLCFEAEHVHVLPNGMEFIVSIFDVLSPIGKKSRQHFSWFKKC